MGKNRKPAATLLKNYSYPRGHKPGALGKRRTQGKVTNLQGRNTKGGSTKRDKHSLHTQAYQSINIKSMMILFVEVEDGEK